MLIGCRFPSHRPSLKVFAQSSVQGILIAAPTPLDSMLMNRAGDNGLVHTCRCQLPFRGAGISTL